MQAMEYARSQRVRPMDQHSQKVVRVGGLEPPRAFAQQILSLVCRPFQHARDRAANRFMPTGTK